MPSLFNYLSNQYFFFYNIFMSTEINIITGILDRIRAGISFLYPEGQSVIRGELVIEDGAEANLEDGASLIIED